MIAAKVCRLYETFLSDWRRDFPKDPFPVLKDIPVDSFGKDEQVTDTSVTGLISAVIKRLDNINGELNILREQLQRELVLKQFLFHVLEILDSSRDYSIQLSIITSQLSALSVWNLSNSGVTSTNDVLHNIFDKEKVELIVNDSKSSKFNSKFAENKPANLDSTSPKLCYSSTKKSNKFNNVDKKIIDIGVCSNLEKQAELEEMFGRKKNITKVSQREAGNNNNNALICKDNFQAVKSKHVTTVVSQQRDRCVGSPQLTRNFQLLKQTDRFDLVLGEIGDNSGDSNRGVRRNDRDTSRENDYENNSLQSTEIPNIKSDDSSYARPSVELGENVSTIQLRKPGLKGQAWDMGSSSSESEVSQAKLVSVRESSLVVCQQTTSSCGSNNTVSSESVHNFSDKQENSSSFNNSFKRFSSRGSVVPPPVAKKPVRAGSGKTLPSTSTVDNPVVLPTNESSVDHVNAPQALLDVNNSSRAFNRSHSTEGYDSVNQSAASKNVSNVINNNSELLSPVSQFSDLKSSSHPNLISDSGKECFGFKRNEISTQVSHNLVSESSPSQIEQENLIVVVNDLEVSKEAVINSDTEMSSYRFRRDYDITGNRNSIGDLVEGIGYNLVNVQRSNESSKFATKVDGLEVSNNGISPPDIPYKMPLHTQSESNAAKDERENIGDQESNHHTFVSSSGVGAGSTRLNYEENTTSFVSVSTSDNNECTDIDTMDHSLKPLKRLSSTPNYENWTINRAITTSNRDYFSVSDDDELDEIPPSPTAASPYNDDQKFAKGSSKDSGLSDGTDGSHTDTHSDPENPSGQVQGHRTILQVGHSAKEDDRTFHETVYLRKSKNIEVSSEDAFVSEAGHTPYKREEDNTGHHSADRLSVDTLSVVSDEETSANMDSSYDETDSAREGMLRMRQLLVKGVLDSEKSYLGLLSLLIDYKRSLEAASYSSQPVISKEDIQTIFSNIETVNEIHTQFVQFLEAKVASWTHEESVGEIFKLMISRLIDFRTYLINFQKARVTIHKCCLESEQFDQLAKEITVKTTTKEITSLEDALFKPVQRVQRNTLVLYDLIKYTPEDHPDYEALKIALRLSQNILEDFAKIIPQNINTQDNRRLVKSSFLVEDVGGVRKLRYIFLFSEVLVCTKREIHRNNKVSFEIKWFAPLSHTTIDTKFSYTEDNKTSKKDDITELKRRLKAQKRELKTEIRKSDEKDRYRALVSLGGGAARNVEKLKKKVNQTEAQLILASPKLPFKVLIEGGKSYTLLMSTDYEREEWKEAVLSQCKKVSRNDQSQSPPAMSSIYIQELVNNVKETPQVNKIGNVLLQKDEDMLTGILNVTIHKVNGLTAACDTYCIMEMDSFGHFFFKAKTTVCEHSRDPAWNEDFDLELEGSETLRILCFKKEPGGHGDTLLGRGALELNKHWLKGSFQEKTLSMNEIFLVMSVRHIPADKTMQRTPSRTSSAVFGVAISSCTKREGKTVPTIVTACVQEVEKRGLDEVGIYRVSGVSSDLQNIKKLIDKNSRAVSVLQDADIHSVTGVLKLYLRELPEPLFTEACYKNFIDTLKLKDEEAKTQCMLALLHGLPDPNYYTIVYLLEHLIKVARLVGENKMSIHNLSTIFGPTLLAPAAKQVSSNPLEMMCKGAEEVMQQANVVNFLLSLVVSGKSLRRSA